MAVLMCAFGIFLIIPAVFSNTVDEFSEELYIKSLPSGHVYSRFQFVTKWDEDPTSVHRHFHLFPRSLGEILSRHRVVELHLSLTQGVWRHQAWGSQGGDAPPGVELWVAFQGPLTNVEKSWSELTNSLAGLFCASLNFLDETSSVNPTSLQNEAFSNDSIIRYAVLPGEGVCTENLTPWKKLLPCSTKAGLATLLTAGYMFNTHYHSLGVHVVPVRKANSAELSLELRLTVALVSEPTIHSGKLGWSFKKLYGNILMKPCSLATSSLVHVDVTERDENWSLTPEPIQVIEESADGRVQKLGVYDVNKLLKQLKYLGVANSGYQTNYAGNYRPVIFTNRHITGLGNEFGGIQCEIYYQGNEPLVVTYMEVIPWYLRVYVHTLRITSGGEELEPLWIHYVPSRDRWKPTLLEVAVKLMPKSVTTVRLEFERSLLTWTEYPPDANHGFYIGAARISSFNDSKTHYFHTQPVLVSLPTPDFSMPYNVICLTCTAVALAFGPIHNLTVKRLQVTTAATQTGIWSKVKRLCSRLWKKKDQSPQNTSQDAQSQ